MFSSREVSELLHVVCGVRSSSERGCSWKSLCTPSSLFHPRVNPLYQNCQLMCMCMPMSQTFQLSVQIIGSKLNSLWKIHLQFYKLYFLSSSLYIETKFHLFLQKPTLTFSEEYTAMILLSLYLGKAGTLIYFYLWAGKGLALRTTLKGSHLHNETNMLQHTPAILLDQILHIYYGILVYF